MSPIGLGSTFGIASEFTNEIYDISNDANQAAYKEGGDTWTMILGIVVTLLPKVWKENRYIEIIYKITKVCSISANFDYINYKFSVIFWQIPL